MGYFKINTPQSLSVWDAIEQQRKDLSKKATDFAKKFGGKPVFRSDVIRHAFYAIQFPNGVPTYGNPQLWTVANGNNNYTNRPKKRLQKD